MAGVFPRYAWNKYTRKENYKINILLVFPHTPDAVIASLHTLTAKTIHSRENQPNQNIPTA